MRDDRDVAVCEAKAKGSRGNKKENNVANFNLPYAVA
jgi:hypothetical protein